MIISCSAKAIQLIQQACANRIGKGGARPTIVAGKEQIAKVREAVAADPANAQFVWNLDLETSRVNDRDGGVAGYLVTGYLHNATYRCTVILNGLDDADLCLIAEVAKRGIRTVFDDFVIIPEATEAHLKQADALDSAVRKECGISSGGYYERLWERVLIVPNGDRSATASLNHAKSYHQEILFGGRRPPEVSTEIVDRNGCFYLNQQRVAYKGGDPEYDVPMARTRNAVLGQVDGVKVPAVKLRLRLIEDHYSYRDTEDEETYPCPEMYRDITVPLSVPLSWLHQAIQKTMNWADYHLHAFRFLDFDAREMLEHAFKSIYGIRDWADEDAERRGETVYNAFESKGEEGFQSATNMSLRWLYHDFMGAMERGGELDEDFPHESLPEDCPLGMYLLGDRAYREMLQKAGDDAVADMIPKDGWGVYYNYDFGDDWELSIIPLEYCMANAADLPAITGASGHTPPEDVGGLGGYEEFVKNYEAGKFVNSDGLNIAQWAKSNGWQPFEGLENLQGHFSSPSTWGH